MSSKQTEKQYTLKFLLTCCQESGMRKRHLSEHIFPAWPKQRKNILQHKKQKHVQPNCSSSQLHRLIRSGLFGECTTIISFEPLMYKSPSILTDVTAEHAPPFSARELQMFKPFWLKQISSLCSWLAPSLRLFSQSKQLLSIYPQNLVHFNENTSHSIIVFFPLL